MHSTLGIQNAICNEPQQYEGIDATKYNAL